MWFLDFLIKLNENDKIVLKRLFDEDGSFQHIDMLTDANLDTGDVISIVNRLYFKGLVQKMTFRGMPCVAINTKKTNLIKKILS